MLGTVLGAHAVLLAGGTVEPRREFAPLYNYLPPQMVSHFSAPHVVPPCNVFAAAVTAGIITIIFLIIFFFIIIIIIFLIIVFFFIIFFFIIIINFI